ncbi:MAG: DUF2218 domain-containing protein [Alphaproteobacteria bacterium]|nr:MAG: DUF2218 domain-containing protein [Alphaproteobacteria bacterium]
MSNETISTVKTTHGSRYLQQLCKHFRHKIPADFNKQAGRIIFEEGKCDLAASENGLVMTVSATGKAEGARLQNILTRHLERFAFREDLEITWSAA